MPPVAKRMRKAPKAAPTAGEDLISALPDEVLHHLLSFLPAQHAVQTCVLARRWRHLWKSATGLRIEYDFDAFDEEEEATKVVSEDFIEHLLLLRGSAPLDTFEFKIWSGESGVSESRRVNLWIRHAVASLLVRNLVLHCRFEMFVLDDLTLFSRHLASLELLGLWIQSRSCKFSGCPALQHLKIDRCLFISCDKIVSSGSLQCLSITDCEFSNQIDINGYSRTQICVPSLVSLQLGINYGPAPLLEIIPSLVDATVTVGTSSDICFDSDSGYCGHENCNTCNAKNDDSKCVLLNGLSEAKNLTLMAKSKSFIFRRDLKWCPTFTKLKTLLLNDHWCVAPDFQELSCILKHSPVLEKLTLHLYSKGPEHKVKMRGSYGPMERPAELLPHLKIVEVKCQMVDESVSRVLKFLCALNICFSFY